MVEYPGDEVVDAALARQEADNPGVQQPAEVPGKKTRCSSCLSETEGARAKNNLKKVTSPMDSVLTHFVFCWFRQCFGSAFVHTYPDPAQNLNADPDPGCQLNTHPDPRSGPHRN
jgi:hypothetical protein